MKQKSIYLAGFYGMKPRAGVNTNIKGWMKDPSNLQYDEKVEITRGEKRHAIAPRIVLNLSDKIVVKNGFNDDRDFKSLFKYFFGGYHQYITTIMEQLDPAFLIEIVDELQAEMDAAEEAKAIEVVPVPV